MKYKKRFRENRFFYDFLWVLVNVVSIFRDSGLCRTKPRLAGEEGFEPSISCSRNRRLTAWPLPNVTIIFWTVLFLLLIHLCPKSTKALLERDFFLDQIMLRGLAKIHHRNPNQNLNPRLHEVLSLYF